MKRVFTLFLLLFVTVEAKMLTHFATVTGVASNDLLNVRVWPDYQSCKVGTLSPHARVKVAQCKEIGRSRWCRISRPKQHTDIGWVNAKFLLFDRKYRRISTHKLSLLYSSDMQAHKNRDGSISLYRSIPLKHYSGSDERDTPALLAERVLFSMRVAVYPTLRKALQATFAEYSDKEFAKEMRYDIKTDNFRSPKKVTG